MEIPVGNSIMCISKTPRFEFPSYVKNIEVDFTSMFSIAQKAKQIMLNTVRDLSNRSKKAIEISVSANSPVLFPHPFIRSL